MEERYENDQPEEEEPQPDLPLSTKAGIFLGTAGVASLADVIAHWGMTGFALGGFVAYALAKTSPQIYEEIKKHYPQLPAHVEARPRVVWEHVSRKYPQREQKGENSMHENTEDQPIPHDDLPMGEVPEIPKISIPTETLFTFSQVLKRFTPSLDHLFLGVLPDGTPIFCSAKDLCHVALAGATDGGKSSILRLLLSQLCYAGASVLLLNPHYTHCDIQADPPEDWTPFERYLLYDPMECRKYEVIEHYLKQVACDLLPKRLEKFAHSQPLGKPYFIAVEELPAIVATIKEAPDYLARILREGRKVGIYLITVAQDFLVKTIAPGGGGAVRDCYRTAYYVGGDGTTANVLLDMPVRLLPESELGQGTAMLRSSRVKLVKQACLARVPYVDNPALYRLLGPSTYAPTPAPTPWQQTEEMTLEQVRPGQPTRESSPATPERNGSGNPHAVQGRLEQVAKVYEPGMSLTWLAGILGISEQKAYALLKEARARGLIKTVPTKPKQHMNPLAEMHAQAEQQALSPEESLSNEDRSVLDAYRNGLKTGNAIAPEVGLSSTRVNQILNKLSRMQLIDWQPRKA